MRFQQNNSGMEVFSLGSFKANAASFEVPIGVTSFGENIVQCEGFGIVRSHMKEKPEKQGISFYTILDGIMLTFIVSWIKGLIKRL